MDKKTIWILIATTVAMGFALAFFSGAYFMKSSELKKLTMEKSLTDQEMVKYRKLYLDLNSGSKTATLTVDIAQKQLMACQEQVVSLQGEVDSLLMMVNNPQTQ